MSEEFFKEMSWEQKQQLEKLSGTGYRLSQRCIISINDSKEDIYLCENASDSCLRFGALPRNHSGENDKYTQTASDATSIPVFPHLPVKIQNQVKDNQSEFTAEWFRNFSLNQPQPSDCWPLRYATGGS